MGHLTITKIKGSNFQIRGLSFIACFISFSYAAQTANIISSYVLSQIKGDLGKGRLLNILSLIHLFLELAASFQSVDLVQ